MRKLAMTALTLMTACASVRTNPGTSTFHAGLNDLSFRNEGETLAAHLFLPESYRAGAKLPTVVVTGAWTTVKEQMSDRYARELAGQGIAALTFDFRGYGASSGTPRQWESAERKVSDLKAAADFARSLPMASERIGALAICFGAGYMTRALAEGAHYDSFATVAAWVHDPASLRTTFGQQEVERRYRVGRAARERFEHEGVVEYVPAASSTEKAAAMFQVDYYASSSRGLIPQYDNRFAVMSWPEWLDLNAVALAARVHVPTLVVHSDGSALPANAKRFFDNLGTSHKRLLWLSGNHTDFYDRDPQVREAAAAVGQHFAATL
jgi:fermentation-respiration switch protein FrsA (DUF1100 family)